MKDKETGLEIYGIPSAETLAAMKEIAIKRSSLTRRVEELFASLENGTVKVFAVPWKDGKKVVYSTREEAMQNCENEISIEEVDITIDFLRCSGLGRL